MRNNAENGSLSLQLQLQACILGCRPCSSTLDLELTAAGTLDKDYVTQEKSEKHCRHIRAYALLVACCRSQLLDQGLLEDMPCGILVFAKAAVSTRHESCLIRAATCLCVVHVFVSSIILG